MLNAICNMSLVNMNMDEGHIGARGNDYKEIQ